jgi:hypothetical protein
MAGVVLGSLEIFPALTANGKAHPGLAEFCDGHKGGAVPEEQGEVIV